MSTSTGQKDKRHSRSATLLFVWPSICPNLCSVFSKGPYRVPKGPIVLFELSQHLKTLFKSRNRLAKPRSIVYFCIYKLPAQEKVLIIGHTHHESWRSPGLFFLRSRLFKKQGQQFVCTSGMSTQSDLFCGMNESKLIIKCLYVSGKAKCDRN